MSLSQIEEYIKQCQLWHLNLDDEEVWSKAYPPPARITGNPRVYERRVEFRHVQIWPISSKEPLLGCSPLCLIGFAESDVFTQSIMRMIPCASGNALSLPSRSGVTGQDRQKKTTIDTINFAREFYCNPKLRVTEVEQTNLIDFETLLQGFGST